MGEARPRTITLMISRFIFLPSVANLPRYNPRLRHPRTTVYLPINGEDQGTQPHPRCERGPPRTPPPAALNRLSIACRHRIIMVATIAAAIGAWLAALILLRGRL